MKKILTILSLFVSVLGLQSCSENFQVTAPYKPITFVYGLLDIGDTAHYIRIQKAFLDENKSAIDMAKNADSNFYNEGDISVIVKEKSNGVVINTYTLQRVDLNNEGYPKDTGIFFNSPNYAYKFKAPLNANNTYQLYISNHLNNTNDSSEVGILDTTKFKMTQVESSILNYTLSFYQTTPSTDILSNFALFFSPGSAKYVEGVIRFHWIDSDLVAHTSVVDSADYKYATKYITNSGSTTIGVPNTGFYNFLYNVIKPASSSNISRYIGTTDFFLYGGGDDYYNYLVTTQLQSSGLTSNQIKPTYTNIRGKDIYGIFSSKAVKIKRDVLITDQTIDSIKVNPTTISLNIRGRIGN